MSAKGCTEWRHVSAMGNYVRIRWTPEGLQQDTGFGWEILPNEVTHSAEYAPSPQVPVLRYARTAPDWWGKND